MIVNFIFEKKRFVFYLGYVRIYDKRWIELYNVGCV